MTTPTLRPLKGPVGGTQRARLQHPLDLESQGQFRTWRLMPLERKSHHLGDAFIDPLEGLHGRLEIGSRFGK